MVGFPVFMMWLWLSITFNGGVPLLTVDVSRMKDAVEYVATNASLTVPAAIFYFAYTAYTWALAEFLPGPVTYGAPYDPEDPTSPRHAYVCNGAVAWYITLLTALVLHVTGLFDLVWLVDNFGHLMSTGIVLSLAGAQYSLVQRDITATQPPTAVRLAGATSQLPPEALQLTSAAGFCSERRGRCPLRHMSCTHSHHRAGCCWPPGARRNRAMLHSSASFQRPSSASRFTIAAFEPAAGGAAAIAGRCLEL
jgi:hypothetical protein